VEIHLAGAATVTSPAREIILGGHRLDDVNTLGLPAKVAPVESNFPVAGNAFTHSFAPYSLTILRVKAQ
jgi:alpha-N-arabinofuranosidase